MKCKKITSNLSLGMGLVMSVIETVSWEGRLMLFAFDMLQLQVIISKWYLFVGRQSHKTSS